MPAKMEDRTHVNQPLLFLVHVPVAFLTNDYNFRSADGTSSGFTFTSGNGKAFASGGTDPSPFSGGFSFFGSEPVGSGPGSAAFSSSGTKSVHKKVVFVVLRF
jgi:hypothetical protein